MATLRRQPRSRTASTRQDRGSCSSTASCPVFSGPYSDHEEDPPLRRQSSPLLKGSLSSLYNSSFSPSSKGSLSSLQGSVPCLKGSLPSLPGSLPSLQRSLSNLKGTISRLKRRSLGSLENSSPSPSASPSERSTSPSLQSANDSSSDDDGSWDTNSWSSGATCLLRTPVKQDSNEASGESGGNSCTTHQASATAIAEPEVIYQNLIFSRPAAKTESKGGCAPERTPTTLRKDVGTQSVSLPSLCKNATTVSSHQRDEKTDDKRKFSQFLNEVTFRVLKSNGGPPQQQPTLRHSHPSPPPPLPSTLPHPSLTATLHSTPTILPPPPSTAATNLWYSPTSSNLQTIKEYDSKDITSSIQQWSKTLPSCKILEPGDVLRKVKGESQPYPEHDLEPCTKIQAQPSTGRLYLETDIDRVRRFDELVANGTLGKERNGKGLEKGMEREKERENRIQWERNGGSGSSQIANSYLPPQARLRALTVGLCSFHDHKDDLRKRLSYTTHKLEMVETEFDSTRQYLETELRRAQEELEKFTDKLRRIQSSYAALQRINQDLEDKMHRTSHHHEEEKRALSREIIVLNNHLMEAKITINKLREDNDLYRKDCNLAAQLLQCSKSHYRVHKMSELPLEFQERISSHMEKHNRGSGATMAMCHSNYSDAVPTAVIAKVLEKPEPGSSCPVTRSPSPQPQDGDFLTGTGSTDHLNRRISYKSSDLYCSDTALYCPERWQDTERRQSVDLHGTSLLQLHAQNSTDSNPDEEPYNSGSFSHHEPPSSFHHHDEFGTGSLPASSSYSSFSLASDEKGGVSGGCGRTASSTLSSSHQGLYMDWRDGGSGDYGRKSMSSYDKDSPSFPKSLSIQHMVTPRSPQKGTSPAYTRTASCFSEPYHSSTPRLASSHSMGSTTGLGQARGGALDSRGDIQVPDDDLSSRWRQLSVEDINTFSSSYRDITGRVSPYSFSERHFAMGPSSKVKGSLYSSFQEGDDVFHSQVLDQCFAVGPPSPSRSPKPMEHRKQEKTSVLYRAKADSQDSECSLFLSGSSKEKESIGGATAASSAKKDYVNLSADSSAESLHQSSLEASSLQHYPSPRPSVRPRPSSSSAVSVGPALPKKTSPRYQKFGSTGLTRKDSLTKAQLYGTLLN
ncbi:brain-enriched guanylate kinase-associated protein [Morone saxatilis]|uniref:brain-enriched guanylate kinase-associated protein n=1 Tax=Morone saxatilis TaxID=34816 RepID=UPI0015E22247|nr:brain-enriched guanylate kinase-associated protein [Morone saxatilis]